MTPRLLFVDDEAAVLEGIEAALFARRREWQMSFAQSGHHALSLVRQEAFDVVVADMRMPAMDGIALLTQIRDASPETVRMMLTGNTDLDTAIAAVNAGNVFRFLTKPCAPGDLMRALEAGVAQYRLVTAERELLTKTLSGSTRLLVELLSMTDPEGFGQALWLREAAKTAAETLRVPNAWEVTVAAMVSRIGFIALPPDVTGKVRERRKLTPAEARMVARMPETGYRLLSNIPRLESVARIVLYQDKHFDGTGWPEDEVKGKEIPLGARLLKILGDLVQISTWERARFKVLRQMRERTGWYDPELLEQVFPLFEAPGGADTESVPVALGQLRLGQKLCVNVQSARGEMIAGAGSRVSPALLERLQNVASLTGLAEPIYVERELAAKP